VGSSAFGSKRILLVHDQSSPSCCAIEYSASFSIGLFPEVQSWGLHPPSWPRNGSNCSQMPSQSSDSNHIAMGRPSY
jgi:hypothetical protein